MSSRQLRRLQQLVSAYQEADELVMADEEGEGPSTQLRPSTASKRNALRRRRGGVKGTTVDDNTEMVTREDMKKEIEQEDQDPALVRSNSSSSSCASSGGSSRKSSSPVKEQSEGAQSTSLPAMQGGGSTNTTAAGKKKRKNNNKNNNNARGNGAGNQKRQTKPSSPASHPSLSSSASPAPADSLSDPARDIVHRLMACDSSKLDTRLERLRNFGPQSLEEIGDGRTRARKKGEPRDTGSNSIFNEHPLARMPFCPLATPNSYRWPSFEPDGAHLSRTSEGKQNGVKHDIYALQVGEKFQIAESRRTMVTELNGDFMDLLNCLGFDFYHLPTLIALSHSFDLMNASYRSHEMADMALYRVGVLLMCSSFPLSETWREREAPMKVGMNKLILETLVVGYHHAMRRGCARSAFELSRLLLSLDRSDPYGALLMMDYAALRSKQWVWLLQLIQEARAVEAAVNSKKFSVANGKVIKDVSFRLTRLPGFAFTAAAAAFLLEKEGSHAVKREKSKVLMQLDRAKATLPCMKDLPSAVQLMRDAVLRFPITTECLMAELGIEMPVLFSTAGKALTIKERTCKAAAAQRAEAAMTGGPQKLLRLMEHFSKLFVARQIDFWRSSDLTDLLVSVLGQDESTAEEPVKKEVPNSEFCPDEDPSRDSVMTGISTCLASPQHALSLHALSHFNASAKLYMSIKVEDITGAVPVIPQEALNLEEEAEGRDAEDLESWDSNTTVDIQEVYPDPD